MINLSLGFVERPNILFSNLRKLIVSVFFSNLFTNPLLRINKDKISCKFLSAIFRISLANLELILTKLSCKKADIVSFSDFIKRSCKSPILVDKGCGFAYFGCLGKLETTLL